MEIGVLIKIKLSCGTELNKFFKVQNYNDASI